MKAMMRGTSGLAKLLATLCGALFTFLQKRLAIAHFMNLPMLDIAQRALSGSGDVRLTAIAQTVTG
jgi:hypothetical protein